MAGRDYPRLSIEEFGRHLLEKEDLDPVYIALRRMQLDGAQLNRWLIAYWCLYHCGAASLLSEQSGTDFWDHLMSAAVNTELAPTGGRWPRGHERRHFRGQQGISAVAHLEKTYGAEPEGMVEYVAHKGTRLVQSQPIPFVKVTERVQEHRLFGPWIGFKVADMIDRVMETPVNFDEAAVFMFKDPRRAALMLWRERHKIPDHYAIKDEEAAIHQVVEYLSGVFSEHAAPPLDDRPVGLQEVETILCKWKSHRNGHYPLFNDIDDIRGGLADWTLLSPTAREFERAMPRSET